MVLLNPQETQMMSCPWHLAGWDEHPGLAPDCAVMADNIAAGRVIPIFQLVAWVTMALSELGPLTNILWLNHLVEWGDDEAKVKAKEELEKLGELDDI